MVHYTAQHWPRWLKCAATMAPFLLCAYVRARELARRGFTQSVRIMGVSLIDRCASSRPRRHYYGSWFLLLSSGLWLPWRWRQVAPSIQPWRSFWRRSNKTGGQPVHAVAAAARRGTSGGNRNCHWFVKADIAISNLFYSFILLLISLSDSISGVFLKICKSVENVFIFLSLV